jgi:hypothetical protein
MEKIEKKFINKEELSFNSLEKIKDEEIKALYQPIENVIQKIKNNIENREYGLVIGEDTSGRIPALVFYKILKSVYKKEGQLSPNILYMSGIRWYDPKSDRDKEKEYINHLKQHAGIENKKVLVVTEYIKYGYSILPIIQALKALNIQYDIATCVVDDPNNEGVEFERFKNMPRYLKEITDHLYYGIDSQEVENLGPDAPLSRYIFGNTKKLSGVARNQGDLLSQHINRFISKKGNTENVLYDQTKINEARKDVSILANVLLEKNFNKNVKS